MTISSPPADGPRKGEHGRRRAAFVSPPGVPDDWEVTRDGRWKWLDVPGGLWMSYGTYVYPTRGPRSTQHHGRGRPRLRDTQQLEIVGLADDLAFDGSSVRSIARARLVTYPAGDEESIRKTVSHQLRRGLELLHDDGCLPWAAYPRGARPPSEWWLDEPFLNAARSWRQWPALERAVRAVREAEKARITHLVETLRRASELDAAKFNAVARSIHGGIGRDIARYLVADPALARMAEDHCDEAALKPRLFWSPE